MPKTQVSARGIALPGGGWAMTVAGWLPPGKNGPAGLLRAHWSRRRRLQQQVSALVLACRPPRLAGPVEIVFTRTRTRGPAMDLDNATTSFGLIGDALVAAGAIKDDNPGVLVRLDVRQEWGAAAGFRVEIRPAAHAQPPVPGANPANAPSRTSSSST